MSTTHKYYLRLNNDELQWSTDQSTWTKVSSNSPSTGLDQDDEMEWETNDAAIQWIKIKFNQGNIIPNGNLNGNQSKKVAGKTKNGLSGRLSDKYSIKVKPSGGGAPVDYDPTVKYPDD